MVGVGDLGLRGLNLGLLGVVVLRRALRRRRLPAGPVLLAKVAGGSGSKWTVLGVTGASSTLRTGAVVVGSGIAMGIDVAAGAGFWVGGSTLRAGAVVVGIGLVVGIVGSGVVVGFRVGGLVARLVRRVVMVRRASV